MKCASWVKHCLDKRNRHTAITAGYGAGKTHGAVQAHLLLCFGANRKSRHSWFCAPHHADLIGIEIPKFREVLETEIGWTEGLDFDINKSQYPCIILHKTKQVITLKACHNAEHLKGESISHATIDEAAFVSRLALGKINARIRCPKAGHYTAIYPTTPEGLNEFADMFNFDGRQGNKFRYRLSTYENPFHPDIVSYAQDIIDAWKHDPQRLKAYLYGIFTSFASGAVAKHFDPIKHVDDSIKPIPGIPIVFSWDFNAFPLAWLAFQYDSSGIRVIAESDGKTQGDLADETSKFIQLFGHEAFRNTPIHIYGDRTGHATSHKTPYTDYQAIYNVLIQHFNSVTVMAEHQVAPEAASGDVVNKLCYHDLTRIHPRCVNLKYALQKTAWKENTRKIDKPSNDTWTHWFDALKYPCYWLQDTWFKKRFDRHGSLISG